MTKKPAYATASRMSPYQHPRSTPSQLAPHYGLDCPAAVVAFASRTDEIVVRGSLGEIAEAVRAAGIRRTAVIVVGRALGAGGFSDSTCIPRPGTVTGSTRRRDRGGSR
jgi:precorrin-4/cobalt-precorrin-4 C11-methyltransferase